jgi:hypothetical protein
MFDGALQPSVENEILLASIGDHFDLADHDVVTAVHVGREGELELADAPGSESKLRGADLVLSHGECLLRSVVFQRKPIFGLKLEADLAGLA